MKKIIKKSCAVALMAVVGTGAVGTLNVLQPKNVFAAEVTASENPNVTPAIKLFGQTAKSASIGGQYKLPSASMTGGTLESVKVTYSGKDIPVSEISGSKYVTVNKIGEYVVTYTFDKGGEKYSASTTFVGEKVSCSLEDVSGKLPTIVPSSFVGANDKITLPMPKLVDNNGEEISGAVITAKVIEPKSYAELSLDSNNVIDFTNAKTNNKLNTGIYSIKYVAKIDGIQVAQSTNYSFKVTDNYEFDVAEFKYSYDNTIESWELGKEDELPGVKATHKVGDTTENVNVSYTIKKVQFTEKDSETKVDVTSTVVNGTKFKPNKEGKYTFTYEVKDFLGHVSTFENNLVLEVEDKEKPVIKVVEAYETTATTHVDAEYKLASKTLAEDIVVMPIWAEDLGTTNFADFTKLQIEVKNLTDSTRQTVFSTADKIGNTEETAPVNKELIFNKTNITINTATQYDTGVNLVAGNKYSIIYTAVDKAGKSQSKEYTLEVVSDLTYETPTLEWVDTIPNAIEIGEKLVFSAPKYSDSIEDNNGLYKVVEYSFDGTTWNKLTMVDSKYEVEVPSDTVASQLKIRATASNNGVTSNNSTFDSSDYRYNHFTGILEKTISIVNLVDGEFLEIDNIGNVAPNLIQGDVVNLPSINVKNDIDGGTVKINVECYHIDGDVETKMTVYDVVTFASGNYKYLESAKITAARDGNYKVIYKAFDAANNMVIQSYKFNVAQNPDMVETRFTNLSPSAVPSKLELGESLLLPTPKVEMLDGSSANWNIKQIAGPSDSIERTGEQYSFKPSKVGTYKIQYFGTVTHSSNPEITLEPVEYTVVVEDTTNPEYSILDEVPQQVAKDYSFIIPEFSAFDNGSGINEEKSYVKLGSGNAIYLKDLKDKTTADLTNVLSKEQEYTLTYYIEDNAGNSVTKTFKIAVGDTEDPEISLEDAVITQNNKGISSKVNKGQISIDLSKISVSDNVSTTLTANDVIITLFNKTLSTNDSIDPIDTTGDGKYTWNIENAGEYVMYFEITDAAGHRTKVEKTFTVDAEDNNGTDATQVLGTILIVVSVLVLAGVIVYFIVSKKKTDRLFKEN